MLQERLESNGDSLVNGVREKKAFQRTVSRSTEIVSFSGKEAITSRLKESLAKKEKELESFSFGEYLERYAEGRVHPVDISELVAVALATPKPELRKDGDYNFPALEDRTDELAIYGQTRLINESFRFLEAAGKMNYAGKGLVYYGTQGSGKSLVADGIIQRVREYASIDNPEYMKNPMLAIEGCPIDEDPINLLVHLAQGDLKRDLKEANKKASELCPHCKARVKEIVSHTHNDESNGASDQHNDYQSVLNEVKVRPIEFASEDNAFVRIDPRTIAIAKDKPDILDQKLLDSNRKILLLSEFCRLGDFLVQANDFIRNGVVDYTGEEYKKGVYYVRPTILATTPKNEWDDFINRPGSKSMEERLVPLRVIFPIDNTAYAKILQKFLSASTEIRFFQQYEQRKTDDGIHISQDVFNILGEFASRTTITATNINNLSVDKKVKLYRGESVVGFTQKNRKEIEAEGRTKNEGTEGLSPEFMRTLINEIVEEAQNCLDPLQMFKSLREKLDRRKGINHADAQLKAARASWEERLALTIRKAFKGKITVEDDGQVREVGFDEAHKLNLERYLKEIELANNGNKIKDKITGTERGADITFIDSIEKHVFAGLSLTAEQKKDKRANVLFSKEEIPKEIHLAVEKMMLISDEEVIKSVLRKLQESKNLTSDEKIKLQRVTETLIHEHGMCPCCAPKLLRYAGSKDGIQIFDRWNTKDK